MTENEVVTALVTKIKCMNKRAVNGCYSGENCQTCDLALSDDMVLAAYQKAIEAVEQRTPKKPFEEIVNFDYGTKSQRCPSCGNPCRHYGKLHDSYDEDFCRKCGQALNWGDDNERKTY